jgi:hypothetical protein
VELTSTNLIHIQCMERDYIYIYIYIYISEEVGDLFLFRKVQTISEVNPVSCLMVTEGSFTEIKVTGGESDHSPHLVLRLKTGGPIHSMVLFQNCSTAIEVTFAYL